MATMPFKYDLKQIPYDYTTKLTNRFKGLDLIECLMNCGQSRNVVQEVVIKTIPKNNKSKKAKLLSEKTLQIAKKRREVKSKREKESLFPFECRVPKNSKER